MEVNGYEWKVRDLVPIFTPRIAIVPGVSEQQGEDWIALGLFIRRRREDLGLSIVTAAGRAHVSARWWSEMEKARRRNVRGDYLGRTARVLEVSLDELRAVLNPD